MLNSGYTSTDAISDIASAADSASAIACFRRFVEPFHIDTFTSGEIDTATRRRAVFHAMEWPERWRNYYFQSGLLEHDPLIDALPQMDATFTWRELRSRRALTVAGTEALNKIAAEGWVDGLVVSLHRSGTHYGLVSLVTLNHHITPVERRQLEAVSLIFHERLRYLVPKEGFRIPPAGLTPREIDCVRLIAEGLSDITAGEALGIKGSTVHEHAERAKMKLQARNRAELVAFAVGFGIISR
jgi:LuxR family transcriptional regulator, quorum-sensing system regulator BjaR1